MAVVRGIKRDRRRYPVGKSGQICLRVCIALHLPKKTLVKPASLENIYGVG